MEKYKLNDLQVRMASFYILNLIIRDRDIVLDDKSKNILLKEIKETIQCIKIDDLTNKDKTKVRAIFHPGPPRISSPSTKTFEESSISFFERRLQKRKTKKN